MHRLLLKINAIFHNAIFGSGEIKTFNSTHKMCKVKSCIKTEKPVEAGWPQSAPMWPFALSHCSHSERMERTKGTEQENSCLEIRTV